MVTRMKEFEVSRCHRYLEKDGKRKKKTEKCVPENVKRAYRLPSLIEGVEDLIELNAPRPELECRVLRIKIPEVVCRVGNHFTF